MVIAKEHYQHIEEQQYVNHWLDVYINYGKTRGYVATLDLSKIKYDYNYTKFWGLNDKHKLLEIAEDRKVPLTNVYLSLNAFEPDHNGQLYRRAQNLSQIRNIGIDLDCYKLNLSVGETIERLKQLIYKSIIPNPNLVIKSGNGVQLIYGIDGGLPPTEQMKWLTGYITNQLSEKLIDLGADFTTNTLERVFRLPNTFNVKPNKPKKLVQAEIWRLVEYKITDLYDYCTPYKRSEKPRKSVKGKDNIKPLPLLKTQGNTLRALNTARLNDFLKIIELRNGKIENRNVMTYDYAFTLTLTGLSEQAIISATLQINNLFADPQDMKEAKRTAGNAFKDAATFWEAFKKNNYRQIGLEKSLIKPKKNSTLIKHHCITSQEQPFLSTLISKEEVYARKVKKRRIEGVKERSEYLEECRTKTTDKLERLKELKTQNPDMSQRELAKLMGVGKSTLNRLIKHLN